MKNFRDLKVWEKAHTLALNTYKATAYFPQEEKYGLCSQMRRSATSIPTNIAEGCGRRGNGELHRFLQIATGSASELEYQLLLSKDLGYLSSEDYLKLTRDVQEVRRMLSSLIQRVDVERLGSR